MIDPSVHRRQIKDVQDRRFVSLDRYDPSRDRAVRVVRRDPPLILLDCAPRAVLGD